MQRVLKECEACHGRKTLPVVIAVEVNHSGDEVPIIEHTFCKACDGRGMKFVEVE